MSYMPRESLEALVQQRGEEIASLRAEVERLNLVDAAHEFTESVLERERDEGLAEARDLLARQCPREHNGLERAMMKIMAGQKALPDPELGQDVAAIAFAHEKLLDRLQRAEVVGKAALKKIKHHCEVGATHSAIYSVADKALAAWEEGKA